MTRTVANGKVSFLLRCLTCRKELTVTGDESIETVVRRGAEQAWEKHVSDNPTHAEEIGAAP